MKSGIRNSESENGGKLRTFVLVSAFRFPLSAFKK